MKNLKDKNYRQQLIKRYLDVDTSIEEEKALADFYRQADLKTLTPEDVAIRNMMLGMEIVAKKKTTWVRFSAIILAAAMLAGLIFIIFPSKYTEKQDFSARTPASTIIRSQQPTANDAVALNPAEQLERADSAFLADTKEVVNPKDVQKLVMKSTIHKTKESPTPTKVSNAHSIQSSNKDIPAKDEAKMLETEQERNNHFYQIYEVASAALPTADQLKIDQQGDHLIVTTIDDDGNTQHYTVNMEHAEDGTYQFQPIAQLEQPLSEQ